MKTGQYVGLTGIVCLLLAPGAFAADFRDDFGSVASLSNWIAESFATVDMGLEADALRIENKAAGFGLVKTSRTFTDFTYSARIKQLDVTVDTAGIAFCWTHKSDGYAGYTFTLLGDQSFAVSRWPKGASSTLFMIWSSHVYPQWNKLTVSKQGSAFHFIINDVRVWSMTDGTSPSGEIGFTLGDLQKALVDDVVVESAFTQGTVVRHFSDNFASDALNGWARTIARSAFGVASGEVLRIDANDDADPATLYVEGIFPVAPLKRRCAGQREISVKLAIQDEQDRIIVEVGGCIITGSTVGRNSRQHFGRWS